MAPDLYERWDALAARVGAFPSAAEADLTFDILVSLYDTPPRAYHNLHHIADSLAVFDTARRLADQPDALELAIWLHDAVYQPERSDNELRSADAAGMIAALLGAHAPLIATVRSLVLVTRHDEPAPPGDHALMADIDLAVLAGDPDHYADYVGAIRREFAFATDAHFAAGRHAFLERMLARQRVYLTPFFFSEREQRARSNMTRELLDIERAYPALHHDDDLLAHQWGG